MEPRESYERIILASALAFSGLIPNSRLLPNLPKTTQKESEIGDIQKKNAILNHLGANIVIKDLKVSIDIQEPLLIIKKGEQKFVNISKGLEPLERLSGRDKAYIFESDSVIWGGDV